MLFKNNEFYLVRSIWSFYKLNKDTYVNLSYAL